MEWHQSSSSSTSTTARPPSPQAKAGERKARPQEKAFNCPRCNSTNTKFCYYNNYSLSQPRYFCKTCRRYWTEGGSLRSVPVGGGSRKNKRPSSLSSSTSSCSSTATSAATSIIPPNPKKLLLPGVGGDFVPASSVAPISFSTATTTHKLPQDAVQDLHLGFPHLVVSPLPNFGATSSSATGLLRPFLPLSTLSELYSSSGFLMQDLIRAPPLRFPVDAAAGGGIRGVSGGFESVENMSNSEKTGSLLFPFEDIKPLVVHDPTITSTVAAAAGAAVAAAAAGGGNGSASVSASEFEMSSRSSPAAGDPPGFWSDIIGDSSGTGEGW